MQNSLHNYFSPKKGGQPGSPASGVKRTASFQDDDESNEGAKRSRVDEGMS